MSSKNNAFERAGKNSSAWVILKHGKPVAKLAAVYTCNTTTVSVIHMNEESETKSRAMAAKMNLPWLETGVSDMNGQSSGYGYDRETAALSRLVVDGIPLPDHCDHRDYFRKQGARMVKNQTARKGFIMANRDRNSGLWTSALPEPGLKYISALGYQVIQVF